MYASPVAGIYDLMQPNFDNTFSHTDVDVTVIGETEKRFLVRSIWPIRGHKSNEPFFVRKRNVKFEEEEKEEVKESVEESVEYDYSEAWWNN